MDLKESWSPAMKILPFVEREHCGIERRRVPVVCSHNEWDPLEEVIVGRVEHAAFPAWDLIYRSVAGEQAASTLPATLGLTPNRLYPPEKIKAANRCLDNLINILQTEGITVRRPDILPQRPFSTPAWKMRTGFSTANPRDLFLVIGDTIIEAPMSDRSRYFETWAYRSLLKYYAQHGAKWVSAPRPQLHDELYDIHYESNGKRFMITEFEPCFDGADFVRCGKEIIGQLSHVTNRAGIAWLERYLGDDYSIHLIENKDQKAIHIDTTLLPLAPGKLLVNPEFVDIETIPPPFAGWDILVAPQPVQLRPQQRGFVSNWIGINVLSLDEKRILVDSLQEALIRKLQEWGFHPIPVDFTGYYPFGGGLHCATLDIRRKP